MRRLIWTVLLIAVLISFLFVFLPAWIIQPFKAQTPEKIQFAYHLKLFSPILTVTALVLILGSTVYLWLTNPRWWKKAALILVLMIASVSVWFSRQNHFEWMFHPNPNPLYVKAEDAKFVDKMDMVLAVSINGDAAAYPVRQLAYHHIVHDTVGGVPIVATY